MLSSLSVFLMLMFLAGLCDMCPVLQWAGNNETTLKFLTRMKIVSNDTFSNCDKSVHHLLMDDLGIEEVSHNALEDFYNLKSLSLSGNYISALSPFLLEYKRGLESFNIANNRLERIEDGTFEYLDNVKVIELQFNNISFIGPDAFSRNLRVLQTVNVSHNALTYGEPWPFIPETDPTDGEDLVFDLEYNHISEFRNSPNWTYDLVSPFEYDVKLSFNNITNIHIDDVVHIYNPGFQGNTFVEYLSFKINASENPFFCDCNVYPFASYLRDSLFYFYRVDEFRYRCNSPDSLSQEDFLHDIPLEQFVCNVTENCPDGCICQERPYYGYLHVNCSFMYGSNQQPMNTLPLTLPTSKNGKISLHLDGHYIALLEQRDYLPQLVNLTLSFNKLVHIDPKALTSMSDRQYLDLSHNYLKYVPKEIQYFKTNKVRIGSNRFECNCNMTWMAQWLNLDSNAPAYNAQCEYDDGSERYFIRDITDSLLKCSFENLIIIISVVVGILIAIIIGAVVTARRCPYETKVLMFRLFGVHPADKYRVDLEEPRQYDIYVSHYEHDLQARQWVKSKFLRKLEENQKRKFKVFYFERDLNAGTDMYDELVTHMKQCRRIVFILTNDFFNDEKNIFEADQAEIEHRASDNLHGRVIYLLWNESVREKIKLDPWKSRMEGKRVLCPDDKFFWSKMRYELPIKGVP